MKGAFCVFVFFSTYLKNSFNAGGPVADGLSSLHIFVNYESTIFYWLYAPDIELDRAH